MIEVAIRDIKNGQIASMPLAFVRKRYRLHLDDAKMLRSALVDRGYLVEQSGNRYMPVAA